MQLFLTSIRECAGPIKYGIKAPFPSAKIVNLYQLPLKQAKWPFAIVWKVTSYPIVGRGCLTCPHKCFGENLISFKIQIMASLMTAVFTVLF